MYKLYTIVIFSLFLSTTLSANGVLEGSVVDKLSKEALYGASVIWVKDGTYLQGTTTDESGNFKLEGIAVGEQSFLVKYMGYENLSLTLTIEKDKTINQSFQLYSSLIDLSTVEVIGDAPNAIKSVHGAATKLSNATIQLVKPLGTEEILSQVPGINGFADDGMGNSRINIGVRGLNPRRSSRVLVLEDGIPIQPAIYVYPNMYYNPPVERLDQIEVIKGSGAIKYGPQTMGGVVNYITKRPRNDFGGAVMATVGTNGYLSTYAEVGGFGNAKWQPELQLLYKRADGYRDYNNFDQLNGTFKLNWFPTTKQSLYLKLNVNHEISNATYTGLTEYSFETNPRYNPKKYDEFTTFRAALDLIYTKEYSANLIAKTKAYANHFDRDWWRENDVFVAVDVYNTKGYAPGDFINPTDYASIAQQLTMPIMRVGNGQDNFGILRNFLTVGVEHSYSWQHEIGKNEANLLAGARLHFERFEDSYKFGFAPDAREGVYFYEDSVSVDGVLTPVTVRGKATTYETTAFSAFVEEKINIGNLSLTPGIRFEAFEQISIDRLRSSTYRDKTTVAFLPGIGFNYTGKQYNIFGGIHRGFTPPSSGTLTVTSFGANAGEGFDLKAEKSWNVELGIRGNNRWLSYESAAFYILVEDMVAAGRGAVFSNLGKVETAGIEQVATLKLGEQVRFLPNIFVNYTFLHTNIIDAKMKPTDASPASATSDGFVDLAGNELPYAPPHNITVGLTKDFDFGLSARLDVRYVSSSFTDFENVTKAVPAGNRGKTDAYTLLNANANYTINKKWSVFVNGKNLLDEVYIGSRLHSSPSKSDAIGSSGILVGARRQVNIGVKRLF